MFMRVFVRTLLNSIFVDNFIIEMFIKICNKKNKKFKEILKNNIVSPITETERRNIFFQSFTGDTIDCNS